jgi:hypothetical protein
MQRVGTTIAEVYRNGEGFWGWAYAVAREAKRAADLFLLLGGLGQVFLEARAAAAAAEAEGAAADKAMTIFEKMQGSELPLNWTTILVGWEGPGKLPRQLSSSEVASYAARMIEKSPEQPVEVFQLADASVGEDDKIYRLIRNLSAQEASDRNFETRKWRLFLLEEAMKELGDDPIYGLLHLSEFWEKFDYPADSPHEIQGRNNQYPPEAFYTDETFQRIIASHRQWLNDETTYLKIHSKQS